MQIGISTAIFYPKILTEDALPLLAHQGFTLGEVFVNSFSEFTPAFAEGLRKVMEGARFQVHSVHTVSSAFEPYLFDAYPRRRADFFRIFQDFVRFGAQVGAKAYTFHGLIKPPHGSMAWGDVVDIYDAMVEEAGRHGIALAQENVSWCRSGDPAFLKRLKQDVAGPLKFTLDVKQAVKAGRSPYEYLDIFGEDLVNLHLNDHDLSHSCLLPGQGTFDFRALRKRLDAVGYEGPGIIEVYSDNFRTLKELGDSRRYLEGVLSDSK